MCICQVPKAIHIPNAKFARPNEKQSRVEKPKEEYNTKRAKSSAHSDARKEVTNGRRSSQSNSREEGMESKGKYTKSGRTSDTRGKGENAKEQNTLIPGQRAVAAQSQTAGELRGAVDQVQAAEARRPVPESRRIKKSKNAEEIFKVCRRQEQSGNFCHERV